MKLPSALVTESAAANPAPTRLTPDARAAYCNAGSGLGGIETDFDGCINGPRKHGPEQAKEAPSVASFFVLEWHSH